MVTYADKPVTRDQDKMLTQGHGNGLCSSTSWSTENAYLYEFCYSEDSLVQT